MIARRTAALLAATALAAALSACSPTTSPTSSPTPTAFASEEEAFAAAEATYRAYVDALNKVDLSDPATFEPVYAQMSGDAADQERKTLSAYHADDLTVTGRSKLTVLEPIDWDPDSNRARLASCVDVSQVDVRDPAGKSIVTAERPDIQSVLVTLERDVKQDRFSIVALDGRDGKPTC
ncbi:hypothetical protein ACIQLK_10980 [Microbacterium sp. NPDC091382]|uniref:hypothetical protein n=1 Tax=Microbacterium sp. NPDC091382 TaxID=3364210 RepID=UPI0038027400